MKKYFYVVSLLIACIMSACGKSPAPTSTMSIAGIEYDAKFVKSGYYFDKATFSDAVLASMLLKVEEIEKPKNLGEIVLPDFSKIEIVKAPEFEITPDMISAEIERERDGETTYIQVKEKREAKLGDKVIIDFKGFMNGEPFDNGEGADQDLVLGSGGFIPGFEEQVAGHKAGKKFSINVKFPDEYYPELAGKDATFDVTIKSIEEPVTPEFDEAYVKSHTKTGAITLEEYKTEIKGRIKESMDFIAEQDLVYQTSEKLLTETKFEPTEEALAWQFSFMIKQINEEIAKAGADYTTFVNQSGLTVNELYKNVKSSSAEFIKQEMLTKALEEKYKVSVSRDEVRNMFEKMMKVSGYGTVMTFDDFIQQYGYDKMEMEMKQIKMFLKVADECKIVEEEEAKDK